MNVLVSTAAVAAAIPTATVAMPHEDPPSAVAALARGEEIVSALRTNYIREGWKIDEDAAERALAYLRKCAKGGPDDSEEFRACVDFFDSHGQSLDWVFDGDRHTLFCGLAHYSARANSLANDDGELLKLEERIFEQYEAARAYDDKIIRLSEIWEGEWKRMTDELYAGRSSLTQAKIWELVRKMPESKEHDRLVTLQNEPYDRMDALIKQMFATPAHTADGRRAKAIVLISCILGDDWQKVDNETEYPERMARNLLLEFVGGGPGEELRDQFREAVEEAA
jgi:hypothetical protein